MMGTLVEISGQKLSTRLLRLERAWSLSEGCVSLSIASSPPAELTIVAAMAAEDIAYCVISVIPNPRRSEKTKAKEKGERKSVRVNEQRE